MQTDGIVLDFVEEILDNADACVPVGCGLVHLLGSLVTRALSCVRETETPPEDGQPIEMQEGLWRDIMPPEEKAIIEQGDHFIVLQDGSVITIDKYK
jgi:hypothetical protein